MGGVRIQRGERKESKISQAVHKAETGGVGGARGRDAAKKKKKDYFQTRGGETGRREKKNRPEQRTPNGKDFSKKKEEL